MDDYDFERRQEILASGDTVEERLSAGADPDELIDLGLIDSDDDVGLEPEYDVGITSEELDAEDGENSLDTSNSNPEIDLTSEF